MSGVTHGEMPPAERRIDDEHIAVTRAYAELIYDGEHNLVCQVPLGLTSAQVIAVLAQVRFAYEKGKRSGRTILQHEIRNLLNLAPLEPTS